MTCETASSSASPALRFRLDSGTKAEVRLSVLDCTLVRLAVPFKSRLWSTSEELRLRDTSFPLPCDFELLKLPLACAQAVDMIDGESMLLGMTVIVSPGERFLWAADCGSVKSAGNRGVLSIGMLSLGIVDMILSLINEDNVCWLPPCERVRRLA